MEGWQVALCKKYSPPNSKSRSAGEGSILRKATSAGKHGCLRIREDLLHISNQQAFPGCRVQHLGHAAHLKVEAC